MKKRIKRGVDGLLLWLDVGKHEDEDGDEQQEDHVDSSPVTKENKDKRFETTVPIDTSPRK